MAELGMIRRRFSVALCQISVHLILLAIVSRVTYKSHFFNLEFEVQSTIKMPSDLLSQLKSLHSDCPAYLTFINRTNFPVDILWIGYNGNHVRYRSRLEPGKSYFQNTFESHPWCAWNSDTQESATLSGQLVFYPKPWRREQQRTVVYIDRPMRPLLEICLQKVRSLVESDDIEQLEIPKDLCERLKEQTRIAFQEHFTRRS